MGRHIGRLGVVLVPLLLASCADDEGPVATDATYNLTCPVSPSECAPPQSTCLGDAGLREILGLNGEVSCVGDNPIIAICEATLTSEGDPILTLVAAVGDLFAFELRGAAVGPGSTVGGSCEVTIIEDELAYGGSLGRCGGEEPSLQQPCQITNVAFGEDNADVALEFRCEDLRSSTTGDVYDVAGPDGGPATVRFARCTGL